tara:strand:- start:612 stop:830 length:219 start_codon:yes stop_codon:yes gene_type:complete
MPKQETIKYTIRQDGNVTEEVINVTGDACVKITEDIELELGDLDKQTYTTDYYNIDLNQNITINTETGDVSF